MDHAMIVIRRINMKSQTTLLIESEIKYVKNYLKSTLTTADRKFFEQRLKTLKKNLQRF